MKDSFHRSLSSLSDAVVRPRFEESTLIRLRDRTMNDIRTRRDTGATLAEDVLRRILYGARHPYSNSELGDEASLPAIALPDIVSYYKKHWRISNATIVVTGDIDISVLRESLTRLVHEWSKEPRSPKSDVEALPLPEQPLPAHLARKIVLINKAGAVQSSIAIGDTGVKRTSDDWLPLEVLNRIVGGGPGSRLYTSLRETYGYTYGVSSQFTEARDGGYFIIRTAVAVENTALAVREILSQLEAIVARPPSDIEVERAKRSAVFGLPLRLESSNQLLDALGNIAVFRLPSDYFNLYGLNMLGITPSQVAHAAKKHLHPESLQIVIVGPTPKIEHDLRMLNVAPVEKRTETGELAVDRL